MKAIADDNGSRSRGPSGPPAIRYAVMVLMIAAIGFGVLRTAACHSDTDQGMAELRRAFHGQRPLEPRTSAGFDYAPLFDTRGNERPDVDQQALGRARSLLFAESDARSRQAVGLFYLVQKEPDQALLEFNSALVSLPDDAALNGDIGAAYLELAKQKDSDLEALARSLKHSEKALELDSSNVNALFNKALGLQAMKLSRQAAEAWKAYLEKDPSSGWAAEARKNLEKAIAEAQPGKTPEELMQDFLAAYNAGDEEATYRLVSRNREMITEKLIPQRFVSLFLNAAGDDKNKYLKALYYLGRLEKERTGDPYFFEIAAYYSTVPVEKFESLRNADNALKQGYQLCKDARYADALASFSHAGELFAKADNDWEANLAEYWIAYCEANLDRIKESSARLIKLAEVCREKNYKWLSAQAYCWLSTNENSVKESSKSFYFADLSLTASQQTFDFYNTQKMVSSIALFQLAVRQFPEAMTNMEKVVREINVPDYSRRQKWRDLDVAAALFYQIKLYDAAAAFESEALALNAELNDLTFERTSLANLSRIYGAKKKYGLAMDFAARSKDVSEKLPDQKQRQKGIGFSLFQIAQVELEKGDFAAASKDFDHALEVYSTMEYQPYRFDAEKGRLLCYLAEKNEAAAREAIPRILELFEKNRDSIVEEQNRDTFFDRENDIYDLVVNYEYGGGNYERSFDYAESSRARSLLDWQKRNGEIRFEHGVPRAVFNESTPAVPLSLGDIRPRIPAGAQLVYYSVLPDKVLIWLVAQDRFESFSFDITAGELNSQVTELIEAIKRQDEAKQVELSHLLYRALFSQVEERLDPGRVTVVIPDKILCHLPFDALISDKTGNYLVADHQLLYAPSATVFLASSESAESKDQLDPNAEKLLSIGDPSFDKSEFPELQPLPSAEKEASEIAEFYPQHLILLNKSATKTNIETNISGADVVQFAGHYITNERTALLSSFAVAGEGEESRWANHEVLEAELGRPRLIVLAACETGIEHYYNGEGMIGAGRSFLAKGVPLVVASQWSVNSDSTAELMKKFHRLRKKERLPSTAALQRAQLEMLNDPNPAYRQPFYWAGFIALGGYAQF